MSQNNVLEKIKGGLIVSCQARKGWPMYGTEIMVAFAKAAEQGGACGIRATEPQNIKAIKNEVDLPMIGIFKQWYDGYEVYITPTYESAAAIAAAGADIVAMDGTQRNRPNGEALDEIIKKIHKNYPTVLVMADCDNLENGKYAQECGADIVSTTMAGYTKSTRNQQSFNPDLVKEMKEKLTIPIIAEGHISDVEELYTAYKSGADSVVIGTAITRPEIITKKLVESLLEE
ncbi:N-acetylmannosamine-6-phosphate 2-epimerase [Tetragenococcus koreensis]|uniref:N-acetylmannosamine-6-phosphate 2-epimerase n=1 Tax=Tetragenococcus koreensis TaxID=290335 RepID=UPI000F4D9AEE|nr:N-acetylmannosamine-6-phosphate 2-epimerase [Tetragenococcus koreensis]AYW44745.1 hypothetical protein C7K43_01685 [Tetragenococcus koreensis]GEN91912.1 putative N-acetylmannosamine-6-phosphate 2-epimerase [Tetragenococcus koreensis]